MSAAIAAAVANLESAIAGWAAALAADALDPQPSYSLDGEQVSRAEWRTALVANIKDANAAIAELDSTWTFVAVGRTN
jgi:hypothetical protein